MLLRKGIALLAIGLAIATTGAAQAANLVSNGGFESIATGGPNEFLSPGQNGRGTATLTDWVYDGGNLSGSGVAVVYKDATDAATVGADAKVNGNGAHFDQIYLWSTNNPAPVGVNTVVDSPNRGHFIASDSDTGAGASKTLEQTISGLTVGEKYSLSFYYAGAQFRNETGSAWNGAFNTGWQVTFAGNTQYTGGNASGDLAVVNHGFTGWNLAVMFFTATSTTETLSFLAISDSTGLPPVSLLDGVSLSQVPEPSSFAMTAITLAGFGALRFRRKNVA